MKRRVQQIWACVMGGLSILVGVPTACDTGRIVGGHCAPGYTQCSNECVDMLNDVAHCGACGARCTDSLACIQGVCGGTDTSVEPDAGSDDAGADASDASTDSADDATPDGNLDSGDASTDADADADCIPPFNTRANCGACHVQCEEPTPRCAPDGAGSFECVVACVDPTIECSGECVDPHIDPEHCGSCTHACVSGICQSGECVGATVGHVVLACMNFLQAADNSPNTVLLGNAVFLPPKSPVRILSYVQYTSSNVRARVNQVIAWSSAARRRTYRITEIESPNAISTDLNINDFDVLLINDQALAQPGVLGSIGANFADSKVLDSFTRAGGMVIVLSGGGPNSEMFEFMTQAGLLEVSAEPQLSGVRVYNRAPADAIGINVISTFLVPTNTCTFATTATPAPETVFVVTDTAGPGAGNPVVVHRVKLP